MNAPADNIHSKPALTNKTYVFRDRAHAGAILADMLSDYADTDALVLAIPAGGVPVALEISARCRLTMDIMPVSKILLPWTTESGFGAVAFDGTCWINDQLVRHFGLDDAAISTARADAEAKVQRRLQRYRGSRPFPRVQSRTVFLVDDGIAAGSTVRAGITALHRLQAGAVMIAVPTAHDTSLKEIARAVDAVYCANIRSGYRFAVAEAYETWSDISEQELDKMLNP